MRKTFWQWIAIYCMLFVVTALFRVLGMWAGFLSWWDWDEYVFIPLIGTLGWYLWDNIRPSV